MANVMKSNHPIETIKITSAEVMSLSVYGLRLKPRW